MTGRRTAEKWALAALVGVVVLSALIRVSGVWFGYPLALHPDEGRVVNPALKMIRTGDLNPHFFNYPSLNIYLQAGLFKAASALDVAARDGGENGGNPNISFYILGRLLTVAMSLATIVVTYLIGRRLVGLAAGLAAAVFVGASTLHILNSFTITVDVPMALWSSLAVLMAARLITGERRLLDYALGGVFVGLAVGSKYTAFLCIAPILIGHFFGNHRRGPRDNQKLIIALAIVPVAFLLTTPFAVLDHASFREAITFESKHYRSGHFGSEAAGSTSLALYAMALFDQGLGPVGGLLAVAGLVGLGLKKPRRAALLASFPFLLLLFVGQYKVFFARNIVAAVPGLAVFSGAGAVFVYELLRRFWARRFPEKPSARALAGIGAALLVILGAGQQVGMARETIKGQVLPDSRWMSLQWIDDNLEEGAVICRERYTPRVQNFGNRYRVVNLGFFSLTKKRVGERMSGCDYAILSSFNFDRFVDDPGRYPDEAAAYQDFFADHVLVREFLPDGVTGGGPRILIFALQGDETPSPTAHEESG